MRSPPGIKGKAEARLGVIANACHISTTWERLRQDGCKIKASMSNLTQNITQKKKKKGRKAGEVAQCRVLA